MKRKIVNVMLIISLIGLTGCGNKNSSVETSTKSSEVVSEVEGKSSSSLVENALSSVITSEGENEVYPEASGYVEITVGDIEAIGSVKIPLNYIFSGSYYRDGEGASIPDMNATTTVEDSMNTGKFEQYIVYSFAMTAQGQDSTTLNMVLLNSDMISFDEIKKRVENIIEIGTDALPGYAYYFEDNRGKGLRVGIKMSEKYTLEFDYFGDNVEKMSEEELAQKIYDLVTIK